MQTTYRVSCGLLLLLAAAACSSKSTKDGADGTAGKGGILTGNGGTSSGGSAGTSSGGVIGRSGSTSTGGGTSCTAGTDIVCLDAQTAQRCDPDTLMTQTAKCSTVITSLGPGVSSTGCVTDADGSGCNVTFEDAKCEQAAPAFTACLQDDTYDALDVYFACFLDNNGAHTIIPCYWDYVDEAAGTVDCAAAEAACLPTDETGAGGAGG